MKKFGKILLDIIVGIWVVVAIFVTICLISYNEFHVTVFGSKTLIIVDSEELEPNYQKGDLLIVNRSSDKKINIGDSVFFYIGGQTNEYLINIGEITNKKAVTNTETTYNIGDTTISGEYLIGKTDEVTIYKGVGSVLKLFESQWGYMFLVVLPTLFAIVYEVMMIIEAAKNLKDDES